MQVYQLHHSYSLFGRERQQPFWVFYVKSDGVKPSRTLTLSCPRLSAATGQGVLLVGLGD